MSYLMQAGVINLQIQLGGHYLQNSFFLPFSVNLFLFFCWFADCYFYFCSNLAHSLFNHNQTPPATLRKSLPHPTKRPHPTKPPHQTRAQHPTKQQHEQSHNTQQNNNTQQHHHTNNTNNTTLTGMFRNNGLIEFSLASMCLR